MMPIRFTRPGPGLLAVALAATAAAQVQWRQVAAATRPSARLSAALAYDAERGRTLLFGGVGGPFPAGLSDTWEWDGANWTQLAFGGPPARYEHAMVYDGTHRRVVVFG